MHSPTSRRQFFQQSLAGPAVMAGTLLPLHSMDAVAADSKAPPLRIVCVGGHPDDPESGCAGILTRYAQAGHRVTVVYLTRGERGISGKSNDETARIRTAECEAACEIMGARALFAGQIDGSTEVNRQRAEEMFKVLAPEQPDLLITHWPIDTHPDHQAAAQLTFRAYLSLARRPQLFFFEVNTGSQSMGFTPNTYVDVTVVLDKKKAALLAHRSQDGEGIWRKHHEAIASFRGREVGVTAAEAFFHLNRPKADELLLGL